MAVIVDDAKEALAYYTEVLGMTDVTASEKMEVPGACVRVGEQTIQLMELPTPDPFDVDPTYSMSAPPPGYVCKGRPVHAGRDRHVAITLHSLEPLKASLEAAGVNYTMSYSGRQALFCRDRCGNGWEFGPPVTYEGATRLFPPYLAPDDPAAGAKIGWGGVPHVGLLGSDTERARRFYCGVLGMVDENDLRPLKLPFPGLFLRCGEQQVHYLELPNPDPDTAAARPAHGRDRRTAYSVKSLDPVRAALKGAGVECARPRVEPNPPHGRRPRAERPAPPATGASCRRGRELDGQGRAVLPRPRRQRADVRRGAVHPAHRRGGRRAARAVDEAVVDVSHRHSALAFPGGYGAR